MKKNNIKKQSADNAANETVSFELTPYFIESKKNSIFAIVSAKAHVYGIKADDYLKKAVLSSLMEKSHSKKITYIPSKGNIDKLIGTMTQNAMIDILRKENHYVSIDNDEKNADDARAYAYLRAQISNAYSPLDNAYEEDKQYFYRNAFTELSKKTSSQKLLAFRMQFFHEMPPKEIAKRLNMTESDVAMAKHRLKPIFEAIIRRLDREDYFGNKAS